ncbi:MAG: MFS transporter [Anaerolineales bacterium]|nr:MFS transporter [Anaerolineales bacterium]
MVTENTTLGSKLLEKLGVLSHRNFAYLWFGQILATFGDKFTEIAIPILIYQLTGSALQLGLAFIFQVVSAMLFGLVGGVMSDRWDRRRTMIGSDLIRAGLIVVIPLAMASPLSINGKLAILYSLIFLIACVKQFFLPAKIAIIPELVPKKKLMQANSLDQAAMKLAEFAGYATAGLLIHYTGVTPAFLTNAGTFLISAVLIWLMRTQVQTIEVEKTIKAIFKEIKDGLDHVKNVPILAGTVVLSLIAPMALGATMPLLIIYVDQVLGGGAREFGLMEAFFGLGLSVGVILVGKYGSDKDRWSILSVGVLGIGAGMLLTFGIPMLLTAYSTSLLLSVALPLFFLTATANGAIFLGIRTIVQENSPHKMIGRVFAVITVASSAAAAAGAAMAGIAETVPVGVVFLGWACLLLLTGVASALFRSRMVVSQVGEAD